MRRASSTLSMLLVAASLAFVPQPAGAATGRPTTDVMILPTVRLVDGGTGITARVRILCRPDGTVWEGFISATQGDTSTLAGLPLICDGRQHVEDVVIAVNDPTSGTFVRGDVTLSAVIVDEGTLTVVAQDTRSVSVR